MKVTVFAPENDQTINLDVQSELTLENFRALCSVELDIAPELLLLIFNGRALVDYKQTLLDCGIHENDMVIVQRGNMTSGRDPMAAGGAGQVPRIDFSSIRMPGQPNNRPGPSSRPAGGGIDMSNPEALRQRFLGSPHDLALLKERNPVLADAVVKGGDAFAKELEKMREAQAQMEREKIRMLNADPLDPEVQNKIAEEIRQQNIQENMNMAIEEAPESFGQVVMLWINVKVNGHRVKAFVDSGAQMTIMSAACAEKCHIMRLVDRRWEGVAKGVGIQKIIGRIHLAQMQIENDFLQCSFSVLEDQTMDVLLGLDMLRRHQCCIDLKQNKLRIGTTGTETSFLHESELPTHGRLHDPFSSERTLSSSSQETEDDRINKALKASAEEALQCQQKDTPIGTPLLQSVPDSAFPGVGRSLNSGGNLGTSSSSQNQQILEANLKQLMDMGFSRAIAEQELRICNGDVQQAIVKLLARSLKSK